MRSDGSLLLDLPCLPARPVLGVEEVHVIVASLENVPPVALDVLSIDERRRADRFREDRDRRRFVRSRMWRRILLGRYLGTDPARLQFDVGPSGKPRLRASDLHFNVSHSEDMMLLAATRNRELGVDIEVMRQFEDMEILARRCMSNDEQARFERLPVEDRQRSFYAAWVRNEAQAKMRGLPVGDDQDRRVMSHAGPCFARELDLGPGVAAALVVEGGWACTRLFRASA